MKILLRKTTDLDREPRVYALDPETGQALTRIENPHVYCSNDDLSTAHEHPEGIYWRTMKAATKALEGHAVVFDPGSEPDQTFTVKMPRGLHKRLSDAAHEQGRSMADIAREAIEKFLER